MTQGLTAISSQERISSIDFLRGLAVLGILVINIESFAYPDPWSPYKYGNQESLDHQVRFWVYFLAQGKFFSMFTMLFGVSFCLFIDRLSGRASSPNAMALYVRRLWGLFLIGVAHAYLIWDGDVLYHYAICGLLLLPFRSFKVSGLVIVLSVLVLLVAFNAIQSTQRTARQQNAFELAKAKPANERSEAEQQAIASWTRRTTRKQPVTEVVEVPRNSIWESIQVNASHQKVHKGALFYQGILFRTLIMMVLGMIGYRLGAFHDYRSIKGYWLFTVFLLVLALLVNYYRYDQWTFKYHQPVTQLWAGVAFAFPKELLGLAYMMLFNGLFQLVRPFSKLKGITNMGRMALSNYLMQSLICGSLFYGYGLGWYNHFSRSELWLIIPCIWTFQIAISSWILMNYDQGPVEKLWRTFIYKG
ncbi:MAG: DUF418 domain-containing protein [Cytophagales bacterium]|nr:DUF418 domain-containing protein [Cytophagales bacterium]